MWEERHFPTLTLDSLGTIAADTTDQAEKKEEEKPLGPKRHDELVLMRHHIIHAVRFVYRYVIAHKISLSFDFITCNYLQ